MTAPQRKPPASPSDLMDELEWTPENVLTMARAFLEQEGDVPVSVEYSFLSSFNAPQTFELEAAIRTMRAEHFARLGKPVPRRDGRGTR
jgi:hypothetical protein